MNDFLTRIRQPATRNRLALLGVLAAGLFWAYWPTLAEMARRWSDSPQYSHGYLVPLFAAYLLWARRDKLAGAADAPPSWWAVPLLLLGGLLRLAAAYLYMDWLDSLSLLPTLAAAALVLAGRPGLRWSLPAIGFLVFMMPLPYRLEIALGPALQQVATAASTYALQTLGFPTFSEGNIILVNEKPIGVAAACSGLNMLVTFVALSTAVALLIRRPWVDRLVILLSAVPIAVVVNVIRITVTGVLYATNHDRAANAVFHDLAGWLMMPLALALLAGELHLLGRVLVPPGAEELAALELARAEAARARTPRRKKAPAPPRREGAKRELGAPQAAPDRR